MKYTTVSIESQGKVKYLRPWGIIHNFVKLPKHLLQDKALGSSSKLIWGVLAHLSADKTYCAAPAETIAEWAGLGRTTVLDGIKGLVDAGYLTSERRGLGLPNVYHFLAAKFEPHIITDTPDEVVVEPVGLESDTLEVQTLDFSESGGQTSPIKGVKSLKIEPSIEPTNTTTFDESTVTGGRSSKSRGNFREPSEKTCDLSTIRRRLNSVPKFRRLTSGKQSMAGLERAVAGYSEDEVLDAIGVFAGLDYWHAYEEPLAAFGKYLQQEDWRAPVAAAITEGEGWRLQAAEPPVSPNSHPKPQPVLEPQNEDYAKIWNATVPERPIEWVPSRAPVKGLETARKDSRFVSDFTRICQEAAKLVQDKTEDRPWLTFAWMLKRDRVSDLPNWMKLLEGSLVIAKQSPASGRKRIGQGWQGAYPTLEQIKKGVYGDTTSGNRG